MKVNHPKHRWPNPHVVSLKLCDTIAKPLRQQLRFSVKVLQGFGWGRDDNDYDDDDDKAFMRTKLFKCAHVSLHFSSPAQKNRFYTRQHCLNAIELIRIFRLYVFFW